MRHRIESVYRNLKDMVENNIEVIAHEFCKHCHKSVANSFLNNFCHQYLLSNGS